QVPPPLRAGRCRRRRARRPGNRRAGARAADRPRARLRRQRRVDAGRQLRADAGRRRGPRRPLRLQPGGRRTVRGRVAPTRAEDPARDRRRAVPRRRRAAPPVPPRPDRGGGDGSPRRDARALHPRLAAAAAQPEGALRQAASPLRAARDPRLRAVPAAALATAGINVLAWQGGGGGPTSSTAFSVRTLSSPPPTATSARRSTTRSA